MKLEEFGASLLKNSIMSKFSEILAQDKPVLIDFFGEWCGPCKTMAPILKEVKKSLNNTAIILKVDVDKNPAIASKLGIRGVPTLVLYKNNKIVWRQSGVVPKDMLISKIKEYI